MIVDFAVGAHTHSMLSDSTVAFLSTVISILANSILSTEVEVANTVYFPGCSKE